MDTIIPISLENHLFFRIKEFVDDSTVFINTRSASLGFKTYKSAGG
jgi:hypothetical protein